MESFREEGVKHKKGRLSKTALRRGDIHPDHLECPGEKKQGIDQSHPQGPETILLAPVNKSP
jgi:hypothetical protein